VKDRLSRQRCSWNMSRIRGKDTTPEEVVRSLLHRMGYRFRLHVRILPKLPFCVI
jgi:DNA mismatch endonuclease, patch repair protein